MPKPCKYVASGCFKPARPTLFFQISARRRQQTEDKRNIHRVLNCVMSQSVASLQVCRQNLPHQPRQFLVRQPRSPSSSLAKPTVYEHPRKCGLISFWRGGRTGQKCGNAPARVCTQFCSIRYLLNCAFMTSTNSLMNLPQLVFRFLMGDPNPWEFSYGALAAQGLAVIVGQLAMVVFAKQAKQFWKNTCVEQSGD